MRRFPCPDGAMRLAATGLGCALILGSVSASSAQAPIPSGKLPAGLKAGKIKEGLSVVERGPNHRVFENWSTNGVRTRYVELASGLHGKDAKGAWKESDHKNSLDVNGALAEGGTVKARFTADINTKGDITAPRAAAPAFPTLESNSITPCVTAEITSHSGGSRKPKQTTCYPPPPTHPLW